MTEMYVSYGGGEQGDELRLHPIDGEASTWPRIDLTAEELAEYEATITAYERWMDRLRISLKHDKVVSAIITTFWGNNDES